MKIILIIVVFSFHIAAYGSKLDGIYTDSFGILNYKFKPDGTVQVMGTEFKYQIIDKDVKIETPAEKMIFIWLTMILCLAI